MRAAAASSSPSHRWRGGPLPLLEGEGIGAGSVDGFAGHPVAVAVHVGAIARVAVMQRSLAESADLVAALVGDAGHDLLRLSAFLGALGQFGGREIPERRGDYRRDERAGDHAIEEAGFERLVPEQRPPAERVLGSVAVPSSAFRL